MEIFICQRLLEATYAVIAWERVCVLPEMFEKFTVNKRVGTKPKEVHFNPVLGNICQNNGNKQNTY